MPIEMQNDDDHWRVDRIDISRLKYQIEQVILGLKQKQAYRYSNCFEYEK